MAITLQLSPEQEARLRAVAGQLKVSPEALAETAVRHLLAQPDEEFPRLAQAIVDENRELYERLR
jgi:predicted transcriptional regulator